MRSRTYLYCIFTSFILLVAISCGGAVEQDPQEQFDTSTTPAVQPEFETDESQVSRVIKEISGDGGNLTSSDGAVEINISEGAVSQATSIEIVELSRDSYVNSNGGIVVMGDIYQIDSTQEFFSAPVEISLRYNEADIPPGMSEGDIFVTFEFEGDWYRLASEIDSSDNTVSAEVFHTSLWSWGYENKTNDATQELISAFLQLVPNSPDLPQSLEEAEMLKRDRLNEWRSTIEEMDFEVEELEKKFKPEEIEEELGTEIIRHITLEAAQIIIESLAGKGAVLKIGGTAVAYWSGLLSSSLYLFDVSYQSGQIIAAATKVVMSQNRYEEAAAMAHAYRFPDSTSMPDHWLKALERVVDSLSASEVGVPNCTSVSSGLVGFWAAEANALDTQSGSDGVINGATFSTGMVGQAFDFSGEGDHIYVETGDGLNPSSFTIDFWLYNTGQSCTGGGGNYCRVISRTNDNFEVALRSGSSELAFHGRDSFGWEHSGYIVPENTWTHIAVSYDNASMTLFAYSNGMEVFRRPNTTGISYSESLYFGARHVGGEAYKGLLDEVHMFNRTLREDEIQSIYNAEAIGVCK